MFLRFLAALAAGLTLYGPVVADDPPKKSDPAEALLEILFNQEVLLEDANINDIPLFELLQKLSKRYAVTFIINEEAFKAAERPDIKEAKPNVSATQLRGLTLHQFLTTILDSLDATYLIKGITIQIVPTAHAARVTKAATTKDAAGRTALTHPLVSAVLKEKPLNEAVALLAERYDLSVVIAPQSGDARTGFVTARRKTQPPEIALELLAVQCDLRVVRKGTAFLITSRDHANEMFAEKLEKERQKIEVEKFRLAPPPKPQPEPKPEPQPLPPLELKVVPKP